MNKTDITHILLWVCVCVLFRQTLANNNAAYRSDMLVLLSYSALQLCRGACFHYISAESETSLSLLTPPSHQLRFLQF